MRLIKFKSHVASGPVYIRADRIDVIEPNNSGSRLLVGDVWHAVDSSPDEVVELRRRALALPLEERSVFETVFGRR